MSLDRRHRALRCFYVASQMGLPVRQVLAWADDQIAAALCVLLKGGR